MKNFSLDTLSFDLKKQISEDNGSVREKRNVRKKDVAIIGMSAKVGSCENAEEFWETLCEGRVDLNFADEQRKKDFINYIDAEGGFLKPNEIKFHKFSCMRDIDKFDGDFFKINPSEAQMMDPIQRMFLQTSYHALEDSGYGPENLNGKNVGVYVGNSDTEYDYSDQLYNDEGSDPGKIYTGCMTSITPSRIAYYLNLKGPSLCIDTGCSSSLTALHYALQDIVSNRVEMAVIGGTRYNFVLPILNYGRMDIYSEDLFTRSFDDFADGTNHGEASCAIVLKQLSKALEDHDNIYAVIKGDAINNDGASVGITVPNMEAQKSMMIEAWQNAEIDPGTVSYIECHGTGTNVGDPIEINAIINALKEYTQKKQFCAIGSDKSNFSHSGFISGITGVIKTALILKNHKIPPTVNFNVPNTSIDFIDSPLYVNTAVKEIHPEILRCGINAFSMNGTNVHIVMEEYKNKRNRNYEDKYKILCLSAVKPSVLRELLSDYLMFLEKNKEVSLSDLTYTVNTSRRVCAYRTAIVFETREQLIDGIRNYIKEIDNNKLMPAEINTDSSRTEGLINQFISSGKNDSAKLKEIGRLYCEGYSVNWGSFYEKNDYQRISAPVYPFEKKRCWFEFSGKKHFDRHFGTYCDGMINSGRLPAELKDQLESFSENYKKYLAEQSGGDSRASSIILSGRSDDSYTDTERFIAQKCYETFGYKEIDINDSFTLFNADSLQMMTLFTKIQPHYDIMLTDVYEYNTVAKLAEKVDGSKKDLRAMAESVLEIQKKRKEQNIVYYSDEKKKYAECVKAISDIDLSDKKCYNNVLLTGSTGYLGVYLLRELLEHTDSDVTLIVRAADKAAAGERVRRAFSAFFDAEVLDRNSNRIDIYTGDIIADDLGLGEDYEKLADTVDCIIHCAANSSHFGEYDSFYSANVQAVENIIMFAEKGKKKDLNHISTFAVSVFNGPGNGVYFTEYDDVNADNVDKVELYYPKTKIIGENLIKLARERGVNANIMRVNDILFDYSNGKMQVNMEHNAFSILTRDFLEIGIVPDVEEIKYNFSYVDYVAGAIVSLVQLRDLPIKNFHISNGDMNCVKDFLTDSRLMLNAKLVSLEEFMREMIKADENNDPKLKFFQEIFTHCFNGERVTDNYRVAEVGFDLTNMILRKTGFEWPAVTNEVFNRFLQHCVDTGFIK